LVSTLGIECQWRRSAAWVSIHLREIEPAPTLAEASKNIFPKRDGIFRDLSLYRVGIVVGDGPMTT
jgi:hypothetical protein